MTFNVKKKNSNNQFPNTIKHDAKIGNIENYGWDDKEARGRYTKTRLRNTIDPGSGFQIGDYISNGWRYMTNTYTDNSTNMGNKYDRAFFYRHLGYPRNLDLMPYTNVRFAGDLNKDGSFRLPNAEYVGLDGPTKRFIQEGIEKGHLHLDKEGKWKSQKESMRSWSKKTSHLGTYSIRENGNSGIYDMFDSYDFNKGIDNRKDGYQIEVRDTIWGKNANPALYDVRFTKEKK